jgi:hypothetical protein
MIVISEFFTVESQLVTLNNKTISLLIEFMVDFMLIFEKNWPVSPTFTLSVKYPSITICLQILSLLQKARKRWQI